MTNSTDVSDVKTTRFRNGVDLIRERHAESNSVNSRLCVLGEGGGTTYLGLDKIDRLDKTKICMLV